MLICAVKTRGSRARGLGVNAVSTSSCAALANIFYLRSHLQTGDRDCNRTGSKKTSTPEPMMVMCSCHSGLVVPHSATQWKSLENL
ncbi:hypothetical protein CR201_G0016403 [Pongo abelii]|uniref:Uncharacterized protein n=1 Tax=Pongo abelii TaxID=9601 RepID=A0A2J8Y3U1_PONAB|nr:hypothetical protein CR201_G0016403 [Pongo abelii]